MNERHVHGTSACMLSKNRELDARCSSDCITSLRVDPVEPRHVLRLQLPLGEREVRDKVGAGLGVGVKVEIWLRLRLRRRLRLRLRLGLGSNLGSN